MKSLKIISLATSIILCFAACKNGRSFDASGTFEAEETIISSEVSGVIKHFDIEEGQTLHAGQTIGAIDSTELYLKKQQILSQINALLAKQPNIPTQLASLKEQLNATEKEQRRVKNLVRSEAATQKQLDDINAQIKVINAQIKAQKSNLQITSGGISKEAMPLHLQVAQVNNQLQKCTIINPIDGTVLTKFATANEMTTPGKPLYKIADLSTIILRAYISGNQLPQVKINQKVKVFTDDGKGNFKETSGTISWINNKAEFTPKSIQTKDERANMVYAIKVKLINDGTYKIGMYGEINFQ